MDCCKTFFVTLHTTLLIDIHVQFIPVFPDNRPDIDIFVVLLMILLSPIIMGRLRIPHIIGMVLAGVIVGKYGLNILERDASFELLDVSDSII